jgi:hypothetical protein
MPAPTPLSTHGDVLAPLLAGVDDLPGPDTAVLAPATRDALRAVATDEAQPTLRRARALRLFAAAAPIDDWNVDPLLSALRLDPDPEIRVQAAWAGAERAARAGGTLAFARRLCADGEPALREVAVLALWRDGSEAARALLRERLAVEQDPAVAMVLRTRLTRWRGLPERRTGDRARPVAPESAAASSRRR